MCIMCITSLRQLEMQPYGCKILEIRHFSVIYLEMHFQTPVVHTNVKLPPSGLIHISRIPSCESSM